MSRRREKTIGGVLVRRRRSSRFLESTGRWTNKAEAALPGETSKLQASGRLCISRGLRSATGRRAGAENASRSRTGRTSAFGTENAGIKLWHRDGPVWPRRRGSAGAQPPRNPGCVMLRTAETGDERAVMNQWRPPPCFDNDSQSCWMIIRNLERPESLPGVA